MLKAVQRGVAGITIGDQCRILLGQRAQQVFHLIVMLRMEHVVHGRQTEVFVHPSVARDVMGRDAVKQQLRRQRCQRGKAAEIDQRRQVGGGIAAVRPRQDGMGRRIIRRGDDHAVGHRVELHPGCGQRILDGGTEMQGVELGVHVQQQGMACVARHHMPGGIAVAQVGNISPCQRIAPGGDQMLVQFGQRGQGGMGRIAPAIGPSLGQAGAVIKLHPRHPIAGDRVLHPFAQQVRDHLGRPVGLVLVDIGRGVVHIGRIAIGIGAFDHGARYGDLGVARIGRPQRARRAIEGVIHRQRDDDLARGGGFVDEIKAVVKELAEQRKPAVGGGHAGVLRADEHFAIVGVLEIDLADVPDDAPVDHNSGAVDLGGGVNRLIGMGGVPAINGGRVIGFGGIAV